MAISLNGGTGVITGVSVGGLPDGIVDSDMLAAGAVTAAKRGAGAILQFKSAEYTTRTSVTTVIPFDDTVPQNTEGTEILTLDITPKSTSNKLVIEFFMPVWDGSTVIVGGAALFQDSTADALAAAFLINSTATYSQQLGLIHIMDAGTTSSTTFKIRVGPHNGSMFLNRRQDANYYGSTTLHTTLRVTEIAA
tara:strand:+ start:534 stop:1112 length:579 start_codon:yes stop_codon:yes gene_type:complete